MQYVEFFRLLAPIGVESKQTEPPFDIPWNVTSEDDVNISFVKPSEKY
jgi:hypothetical protein